MKLLFYLIFWLPCIFYGHDQIIGGFFMARYFMDKIVDHLFVFRGGKKQG